MHTHMHNVYSVHLHVLQSACAVCIRVGSFCDPPEVPGLAHLVEHSK